MSNKYIAQIFVYGDSLQSQLVAVVVPDEEQLTAWAKTKPALASKDFKSLCTEPAVKQLIAHEMDVTGKQRELRGFEFVKTVYLTHEMFTADNGILTPTFKLKRNEAKKKYQTQIDAMYASIEKANAQLKSKL